MLSARLLSKLHQYLLELQPEVLPKSPSGAAVRYALNQWEALTVAKWVAIEMPVVQHMAVYLMTVYQNPRMAGWLREQFQLRGKKLDMGKSCIRFKRLEDLPLDVIGQAIARVPVADYIQGYEDALKLAKSRKALGRQAGV